MHWRTAGTTPVVRLGAGHPQAPTRSFKALKRTGSLGQERPLTIGSFAVPQVPVFGTRPRAWSHAQL